MNIGQAAAATSVNVLTNLAERCHHNTRPDCPILEELERSES